MKKEKKLKDPAKMGVAELKTEIRNLAVRLNELKREHRASAEYFVIGFRITMPNGELFSRGCSTDFVPKFMKATKKRKTSA